MQSILPPAQASASPTSSSFIAGHHSIPDPRLSPGDLTDIDRVKAWRHSQIEKRHEEADCARSARSASAVGLVYSETSGTFTPSSPLNPPNKNLILVDAEAARLKKLRRSVLTAARLHCQEKSKWKVAMVTLTYAPEFEWNSYQVSELMRCLRHYLKRKGVEFRYVWVQEFTKRGRPHYHLLVWLPYGLTLPKPDKRGWWPFGMTKIEWARNAIGYIAKYASKADSLHLPAKGARMHGNGGLIGDALLEQRWWKLPAWARERVQPSDRCKRLKGGGLLVALTGEVLHTPWRVIFFGGQVYIWRVDESSERWQDGYLKA